jgi:LysR family transcriptional regulator for metE and metH
MIDLRHLRTLHALRETDSLHEAAERLHLTQSALSHQFRDMEERIGMPCSCANPGRCASPAPG